MTYDLSVPAALISERMGLHFQENRWPDLIRGLERAAVSLGFDNVHTFIAHLLADRFGQREVHALATHLTIGETYFFRTPETFAMLETRLLPELIAAAQKGARRLRIWSAGCATGQEAYSLAILVSRLIPKRTDWDITILATDINPEALATAQAAEYTQWSFRDTPSWVATNYFSRTGDGRFRLDPAIRDMVTFRFLNLAENNYPSPATGMGDFDLILCRNVIMYFSRDVAKEVADRLQRSVREGGYLMVTASEGSRDFQLTSTVSGGEIIYKKTPPEPPSPPVARAPLSPVAAPAKTVVPPAASRPEVKRPNRRTAAEESPPAVTPPGGAVITDRRRAGRPFAEYAKQKAATPRQERPATNIDPAEEAREARRLADKGDLRQALAHCDAALSVDKLSASLYYLRASILQELGRSDEAEQALQSTLFLDGDFAMARVMLGAIARGQSRTSEAAKYFRAALAQLERMPAGSVLPETDGLTAGEMAEMVASLMGSEAS
jgi:chemotaxis protein methyltransferase CheR